MTCNRCETTHFYNAKFEENDRCDCECHNKSDNRRLISSENEHTLAMNRWLYY